MGYFLLPTWVFGQFPICILTATAEAAKSQVISIDLISSTTPRAAPPQPGEERSVTTLDRAPGLHDAGAG